MNTITTLLISALIPLIIGFIWYNKAVFGNAWMRVSGTTEEKMKASNMAVIFIATYVLGFFISFMLMGMVIHQFHFESVFQGMAGADDSTTELGRYIADFKAKYGNNFRTFKHGALHGTMTGLFFATPIVAILALFERRGFKYVAIHAGFWIVSLALMGGLICQFAMRG
jgi:hypothetical protein